MVGVIQSDTDKFAYIGHTRTQTQIRLGHARNQRQAFQVERAQHLQLLGQQGGTAHVGNVAGEVAHAALGVQHTRFFLTGQSVA